MKIKFTFLFLLVALNISGQVTLTSSDLPIVIINTNGQTILDDPRITVDLGIVDNGAGNRNYVTDSLNNFDGVVSIEIRGSTSQQYTKKSYAFETQDSAGNNLNVPLLGMPPENDWILYAPYPDKTLMRNTLAYYLWREMGHYTSRTRHVEVVRNASYRGVYELMEKIKRDSNRVDISKLTPADTVGDELTGGYIIKIDKTTGSGTETWTSAFDSYVYFQYEYPADVDIQQVQKNYIREYVDSFETALSGSNFTNPVSGYAHFADVNTLIDFMIMQELGRTVDGYRSSCFMYKDKDSKGGKLTMGPLWDFNLSFGNANYCYAYDTAGWQYQANSYCSGHIPHVPFWWARLLQDTSFANQLQCRWKQLRQSFLHTDSLHAWIDSVAFDLDESQQRNFLKWPILGQYVDWNYYIGQTYQDEVDYLKSWIASRANWIDVNLSGTCFPSSAIDEKENSFALKVFPNPFSESATVRLNRHPQAPDLLLSVYNVMGQEVRKTKVAVDRNKNPEIKIERKNLTSGIYFFKIANGNEVIGSGKFVIGQNGIH